MALPKKGVGSDFTILNCNNLCSHSVSSESVSVQPVAEPLFAVQSGPGSVYRAAHSHSRGQRQSLRARMVPRPGRQDDSTLGPGELLLRTIFHQGCAS